jgi:hypothetical protein
MAFVMLHSEEKNTRGVDKLFKTLANWRVVKKFNSPSKKTTSPINPNCQ